MDRKQHNMLVALIVTICQINFNFQGNQNIRDKLSCHMFTIIGRNVSIIFIIIIIRGGW